MLFQQQQANRHAARLPSRAWHMARCSAGAALPTPAGGAAAAASAGGDAGGSDGSIWACVYVASARNPGVASASSCDAPSHASVAVSRVRRSQRVR